MIRAGDLTERITLERHDTETDTWLPLETVPTVWAAATSLGDQQFEFSIRFRNDLVDLAAAQPAMRVIYRGRVLELTNIVESDLGVDLRLTARGHRVEVGDLGSTARRTTIWP
jgi:Phage head-tail joining protein